MRYVLSESQFKLLSEGISIEDIKSRLEYFFGKDFKKKYPGADSYDRFVKMKKFQPFVDFLFKMTQKEYNLTYLKGLKVATIWFMGEYTYVVSIYPILDESNPLPEQKVFDEQYHKFEKVFLDMVRKSGMNAIVPFDDSGTVEVKFDFLNYRV